VENEPIKFFFKKPDQITKVTFEEIDVLIRTYGGVGTAWIAENLQNAFLIGYAISQGRVVGTVTHKHPKDHYRKKIEAHTGLDLSGYLERGYTTVHPKYRDLDIGDKLIAGLIERSPGKKIYVTIRMDNEPPIKLTYKNGMFLAATFINPKTGNELGVFINQDPSHLVKN
jgi:hypothetical protein